MSTYDPSSRARRLVILDTEENAAGAWFPVGSAHGGGDYLRFHVSPGDGTVTIEASDDADDTQNGAITTLFDAVSGETTTLTALNRPRFGVVRARVANLTTAARVVMVR